jgi:cytochrome d ubiquinol oxidase subunit I
MGLLSQWASYPAYGDRLLSLTGITVHWIILQYVLGLSFMSFIAYVVYLKTGREKWRVFSKTLLKGFVIVFAVGAATGTASEFGLVLLWPNLTEAAGRYIYFPLYAEVFAFLMEVVFIYMAFYGWEKFSKKVLAVILLFAFVGTWYSASMIVSVNSYMVTPTGLEPSYDPTTGSWLYQLGYPKITLVVPNNLVGALNITLLKSLGMDIKGTAADAVIVAMPSRIVQRLAYEAWHGYIVKDSILALVANKDFVSAHPEILNASVKGIVDTILLKTVKTVGVTTVTFKSPIYAASILHALGSALTVSGFTVMGAYAIRMVRSRDEDDEYRDYIRSAFEFATIFSLTVIVIQGAVFGHMIGRDVAHYNPEKMAAIEGVSNNITTLSTLIPGGEKLMSFLAYGNTSTPLPNYDAIPKDYCVCRATYNQDIGRIKDCRPPLFLHYIYYSKIGLALLLGLYALILSYYIVIRKKTAYQIPGYWILLAPPAAFVAQLVSILGWFTREIGRKPWTIYGVMTVDVAHTMNPASTLTISLIAIYFIALIVALVISVWKILWVPGASAFLRPGESVRR